MRNIKKIGFFISFILLSFTSYTQQGAVLLKAGFTASNLYPLENDVKTRCRNSFIGGLNFQLHFSTHLSLMLETNYLPMGMRIKDDNNDYKLKNNYIQLALKPVWYINEETIWSGSPGFFIGSGPYVSYLLNSKATGSLNNQEYDNENLTDNYNSQDYGIVIG